MDDQKDQPVSDLQLQEEQPQEEVHEQAPQQEEDQDAEQIAPPPPQEPAAPISMIKMIGFGVLLLVSGFFFFFIYSSNSVTPQPQPTGIPTQQPATTIIPTAKPVITATTKPIQMTQYNAETFSVKVPTDWKNQSNSSEVMSFTSSDSEAIFTVAVAPNSPVMTAREVMDRVQNVSSDDEPYYDHQSIGNSMGLYYGYGKTQTYVVSNDKKYWTITFTCVIDCTSYTEQKNAIVASLIFK